MRKVGKVAFWVFVGAYLAVREWPLGDILQTVADILLLIAVGLTIADYVIKSKR